MARFEGSGRSRRDFAAEAGVGLAIFQYWLYKLRREGQAMAVRKAPVAQVRLLPVTVRARTSTSGRLEIRVGGVRLRVPGRGPRICRAAVGRAPRGPRVLTLPPSVRIYLAVGQVDMRRGHDGLAAIVLGQWKLDLYGGHLFVFLGRRSDRCKILFWDRGGSFVYYKRLERGRFRLPRVPADATSVTIDATELAMLLDGIDVVAVKRPRKWTPPSATAAASA